MVLGKVYLSKMRDAIGVNVYNVRTGDNEITRQGGRYVMDVSLTSRCVVQLAMAGKLESRFIYS